MDKFFRIDKAVKTPTTDLELDEFDQIQKVKITKELYDQTAEYTTSLRSSEEEILNEMREYFIVKRQKTPKT